MGMMGFRNDDANGVGAAIFGIFCLVVVVLSAVYVSSITSQQPTVTDTYGNTFNNVTNTSQNLTSVENLTPGYGIAILVSVIVFVCMVLFGFYIYSKTFMT
jgi:hypothetical protein